MLSTVIVSNNPQLTDRLSGLLQEEYQVESYDSLLNIAAEYGQLVLLGADQMDLHAHTDLQAWVVAQEKIGNPVILCWPDEAQDLREQAIALGCSDYLTPPFYPAVVNAKCQTYMSLAKLKQSFEGAGPLDENPTCAREHALLAVQDAAILCLATIARVRDHSTGNHILRTQHYVKSLAEHLRKQPQFADELDSETIELFYKTSALHDIGKVGIPDHILQKPGALTDAEYEVMKTHTLLGYQAVSSAEQLLNKSPQNEAVKFLKIAQQVTLSHHERWDGEGYPQGLKGEQIPLVARLMAVADVYDAMISRRPYKGAQDHDHVKEMIVAGRGSHFDPAVVDAFLDLQDMFARISIRLEDVFPSSADLTLHSMAELISENDRAG
ncbi:HD-GYP domain-containing protein [Neptuniibacter halophilus]|uniref:HD-GYP domain-containing protein n=1 Tax=Neptuniibacter halophilus TaxID=651666 RepID=UPI0025729C51|nr:HD domain-containing phosphohydrolase [Neptuniibacter halophilus]